MTKMLNGVDVDKTVATTTINAVAFARLQHGIIENLCSVAYLT